MNIRRLTIAFLMLAAIMISSCSAESSEKSLVTLTPSFTQTSTNTSTPTEVPTITPTPVDYSEMIRDFAGKWIGYSVITQNSAQEPKPKTGMRLEIAADRFVVNGQTCDAPKYAAKNINLKDFLSGLKQPDMSFELNQEDFPQLQSSCSQIAPSSVALVNSRTLAARVGDAILYFERDLGVSENGLTVTTELVSESSSSPNYEVHAQVPHLELPEAKNFNQSVRSIIDVELAGFKKNFDDWQIPTEMADRSSFMWIGYDVPLLTPDLVSIRFTVDYYMAGAAHPNHYFRVINYDLAADKEILFGNLFKDSNEALKFLSSVSKKSLTKPDFPVFEKGFQPKMENFINWNLTEKDLRLSFDPYQVAPYAAGPQEVLIPYRDVQDLVNLKSNAGKLISGK